MSSEWAHQLSFRAQVGRIATVEGDHKGMGRKVLRQVLNRKYIGWNWSVNRSNYSIFFSLPENSRRLKLPQYLFSFFQAFQAPILIYTQGHAIPRTHILSCVKVYQLFFSLPYFFKYTPSNYILPHGKGYNTSEWVFWLSNWIHFYCSLV